MRELGGLRQDAAAAGDLVTEEVSDAEAFETRIVWTTTGPEGGRNHLDCFGGKKTNALFKLGQRNFLIVQSRYQGASELNVGVTPTQHNPILPDLHGICLGFSSGYVI